MAVKKTAIFTLPKKGYYGQIITPNHSFLVDEPKSVGGTNKAPNPTNYLLGALASCTAITMAMYAKRKKWELGQLKIGVELKEHLTKEGIKYVIRKDIVFENKDLTNQQLERLLKVAEKCPISKILTAQVEMKENAVDELEEGIIKEYKNKDIIVVWKASRCIHSKKCWKNLFSVFNPNKKPWVDMEGANTQRIIDQVNQCPSGALTFYQNTR